MEKGSLCILIHFIYSKKNKGWSISYLSYAVDALNQLPVMRLSVEPAEQMSKSWQ